MDYEFLKKGSEKADGINDIEEFGITEVSIINICTLARSTNCNVLVLCGKESNKDGNMIPSRRQIVIQCSPTEKMCCNIISVIALVCFFFFVSMLPRHWVLLKKKRWACTKYVLLVCTGVMPSSNKGPEKSRQRWLIQKVCVKFVSLFAFYTLHTVHLLETKSQLN